MPIVSVLTAALPDRAELLAEAADSLAEQRLPDGWELEWILQEDGPTSRLANIPSARHASNGERLGIPVTRNLALSRARGQLVHVLDSDDVLLPDCLNAAIEAFEANPSIHWVVGRADDLLPGNTRLPFPPQIPPGIISPGVIGAFLEENGYPPITCTGITLRTATVRALGGWVAAPRAEDLALVVAISELTAGYLTPDVTWLYRRHPEQITRQSAWSVLHGESMALVRQRIQAVRDCGIRVDGVPEELIRPRADTQRADEDLPELVSERLHQIELEVGKMRAEQQAFAAQVMDLLTGAPELPDK
jgi:glycosyltransferase involved in cell wall biosynthesis